MRILVVTNLYPTQDRPTRGIFVKEQIEALKNVYQDLTIDVQVIEGDRPRKEYLRTMLLLPGIVRKGRYDIVHAHFGLTLISTLFIRVPVIVTFHGSDLLINPTRKISRILAPTAEKAIVVSKKLQKSLGYGEVIPCGIPVEHFNLPVGHGDRHSGKSPSEITILFPSSPENKIKGYPLFKDTLQELQKRGYKIREIHLVNTEREKVPEVYWTSDVMLLTSISEGSPTVIKEAIASKLPFVSVDVGDVKEWADRVEFGRVVPDRNPGSMADAVQELLKGTRERKSLDNRDCISVMDNVNIARRIRLLYDEVMVHGS